MRTRLVAIALLGLAGAAPALAQVSAGKDGLSGRYGLSAAACKGKDYFATFTATGFDLPTYSCRGVSFDQVESRGGVETYQVTATSCSGEMVVRGKSDRFIIVRSKGAIRISWPDGSRSADLVRCGA